MSAPGDAVWNLEDRLGNPKRSVAPWQGYPDYFRWALELSRRGSLIIADNVVRDGAVVDAASSDPNVQAVRRYLELVAAEPRVSATALQTVGCKGYDGFAIAIVIADA